MIYLDYNASAPPRPGVVEAMQSCLTRLIGNPSAVHAAGRAARQGVDEARRQVARLINAHHSQVIFTSGGTEANSLALLGLAARAGFRGRLLLGATEHPSVLAVGQVLVRRGMEVDWIPVDASGRVDPDWIRRELRAGLVAVSVMHANNETGVLQPIEEIGPLCRAAGVPLHTDAIQSAGRLPLDLATLPVALLSISAHKLGGPKGVGALVVDKALAIEPLLVGGGQERNRRAGTENVAGIVGFGVAAAAAVAAMADEARRLGAWRDALEADLAARMPDLHIFGRDAPRLPNTSLLGWPGLDGEALVMGLDLVGFAVSGGSACSSGKVRASHVVQAMGAEEALGRSALRVSLGWDTRAEDLQRFREGLTGLVERLRRMSGPLAVGN
ncbi:MAG: cysteine desulfurase [Magnetococcales bacterium]|nr:cysteine desulfurase [Magnetococcales bacterium]